MIYYDIYKFICNILIIVIIFNFLYYLIFNYLPNLLYYYIFTYLPRQKEKKNNIKKNIINELINIRNIHPEKFSLQYYLTLIEDDLTLSSDNWFNNNIIKQWNIANPLNKINFI